MNIQGVPPGTASIDVSKTKNDNNFLKFWQIVISVGADLIGFYIKFYEFFM